MTIQGGTKVKKIKYRRKLNGSIFDGMNIREDPNEAFENAIKKGMKNPENWMYMYSESGKDYFKNSCTRKYISYKQFSIIDFIKIIIKKISKEGEI